MWIKKTLGEQRKALTTLFEPPMLTLSKKCIDVWSNVEHLDQLLSNELGSIPCSHLLYIIDKFGKQISSNICSKGIDSGFRGQDLSRRPFSVSLYPKRHFMLSSVYISQMTGRPCLSAVQPIIYEQQFLGFLVADFDVRHLPFLVNGSKVVQSQIDNTCRTRHTPATPTTFKTLDHYGDEILMVLSKLFNEYGIFHCTLHYSSGQIILWQMDEPYQYLVYSIEQLLKPDIYQVYPTRVYPTKAVLSLRQVRQVLERFRALRGADKTVYLRSGSINIMNGMVGLCFSCEGAQYMPAEVFLIKELSFWLGTAKATES